MPDPITHGEGRNEDEYFHRLNQKAIEEKRKALDAKRAEELRLHKKETHWMKCPKCGHDLEEVDLHGIKVDLCKEETCGGAYFDKDELELLFETQDTQTGFLGRLLGVFG